MDKALFADATATSIGSLLGTSNTTTYVESAAGIAAGGRTGLTSVIVAAGFALSTVFAPLISAIPSAATSPVPRYRGLHDDELLRRNRLGRLDYSHSSLLYRRIHGFRLLHLLRYCSRLYYLLHRKGYARRKLSRFIQLFGV